MTPCNFGPPPPCAAIMAAMFENKPLRFMVVCPSGCCVNSAYSNDLELPAFWRPATSAEVIEYSPEFYAGMHLKQQILSTTDEEMFHA